MGERIETWIAGGLRWETEAEAEEFDGGPVAHLVELRDGERIVTDAEQRALRDNVREEAAKTTAVLYELGRVTSERNMLRDQLMKSTLAAVPHGPDLLALGAQDGDWAAVLMKNGGSWVGTIDEIDAGQAVVGGEWIPLDCGEWFILRKGNSDATKKATVVQAADSGGEQDAAVGRRGPNPVGATAGEDGHVLDRVAVKPARPVQVQFSRPIGRTSESDGILKVYSTDGSQMGEVTLGDAFHTHSHHGDGTVFIQFVEGGRHASATRPASEPAAAGCGEAEPQGQVGAQVRHGSQERRHAEGYAETRTVAPERALGDDAAAGRESRTIDGVIHEPGCRVHVLSKRPLSPEGCTCRPEPGSEHRDIRMLKPERGDLIGRWERWEFSRMDGLHHWLPARAECAFDVIVGGDPWLLIARAAKPKPAEPAELPDAEKRELERRRDALLLEPYRIRHTIYEEGGHHVAIDFACVEWQYGHEHTGPTYHHALKAALAAHDARDGKS